MDSREPDSARFAITICRQIDIATFANRSLVLTNLITLRQVGIEIALAIENRIRSECTMRPKPGANSQFHYPPVENRQHTRHAHANRTDVRVGLRAELRRASAEKFRAGHKMSVDFESTHRFVCFPIHRWHPLNRSRAGFTCAAAFEGVARAQDSFLAEWRTDQLHPNRQMLRIVSARNRHSRQTSQVYRDSKNVGQIHRERIVHFLAKLA